MQRENVGVSMWFKGSGYGVEVWVDGREMGVLRWWTMGEWVKTRGDKAQNNYVPASSSACVPSYPIKHNRQHFSNPHMHGSGPHADAPCCSSATP